MDVVISWYLSQFHAMNKFVKLKENCLTFRNDGRSFSWVRTACIYQRSLNYYKVRKEITNNDIIFLDVVH